MSTANYSQPQLPHLSYQLPPLSSQTLVHHQNRPSYDFVKQSRNVSLRLIDQEDVSTGLPVYGRESQVEGTVDLVKTAGIARVEVKIDGLLVLKEIAEGGSTTSRLCLDTVVLWERDSIGTQCPNSLPFCLVIPTTFTTEDATFPLPPTYEAHLSGMPGFDANISYSVSATVTRVKSIFSVLDGQTVISTPFVYFPRSRPAVPVPIPLTTSHRGVLSNPDWRLFEATIKSKANRGPDVTSQLFLPSSRVFCAQQNIPFHLVFKSTAVQLAAFMPYGPAISELSQAKRQMRLQLVRQSTVDVNRHAEARELGIKTDIWRVDTIGDATFSRMGDGSDWIAFTGQIVVDSQVKIAGFKASGFHVKDCVVLTMVPTEPKKSSFAELRQVIPVRLTTDVWAPDNIGGGGSEYSIPSTPDSNLVSPGYAQ